MASTWNSGQWNLGSWNNSASGAVLAGQSLTTSLGAVIANAEQIPKTCIVIGLLSAKGSVINLASFFDSSPIISWFDFLSS